MTFVKMNNRPAAQNWNGLVNDLFAGLGNAAPNVSHGYNVPVNIAETDAAYSLEILAPGRNKENFSLKVEDNTLTVSYELKNEPVANEGEAKTDQPAAKQVRKEFSLKAFIRSFSLDDKVNVEAIQAKYEDGILNVMLPKKEETKPASQQINIQ